MFNTMLRRDIGYHSAKSMTHWWGMYLTWSCIRHVMLRPWVGIGVNCKC